MTFPLLASIEELTRDDHIEDRLLVFMEEWDMPLLGTKEKHYGRQESGGLPMYGKGTGRRL